MEYGVTSDGFVIKRLSVIWEEINDAIKLAWGAGVNLSDDSPLGQLVGIFAEREALVWELAQAVYDSMYPDSSSNVSLDNVCAIIGVERLPASRSTVTASLTGTAGVTVPAGSIVSTNPLSNRFYTAADAIFAPAGTVDVVCYSSDYGEIAAPAGTLTNIVTKVTGWDAVTNVEDADIGEEIEIDSALRLRRLQSLQIGGRSTVGGIFANILQDIEGVTDVRVIENDSDYIDSDGRPPHSVECVVKGGADQDIIDKIWEVKPAGIQTAATSDIPIVGTALDDEGGTHTINFSRPSDIDIWMHAEIEVDDSLFNVGSKQKEKITIVSTAPGVAYAVTIDGRTIGIAFGALTKPQLAAMLVRSINAAWAPVTATEDVGSDFLYVESDYSGNAFTLIATDDDTGARISVASITPNTGDAIAVRAAILAYAEINQTIGDDIIRSRYFTPINASSEHILSINVRVSETQWSTATGPTGGESNIEINLSELGDLDTTRTTIEVTGV